MGCQSAGLALALADTEEAARELARLLTSASSVVRKKLRRAQVLPFLEAQPVSLVGMEACATAHYRARETKTLGRELRLMPGRTLPTNGAKSGGHEPSSI